jgi:uncharacterized protein involved in exopolysaccharide biosynthesis
MDPQVRMNGDAGRNGRIFSVRDILSILFRRIYVLKFLMIILPLAVFVSSLLVTPIYRTSAKIMIQAKKENATLLQTPRDPGFSSYVNLNVDEIDLNSEMELLQSMDLWVQVVNKLGLQKQVEAKQSAIKESVKGLVHSVRNAVGLPKKEFRGDSEESIATRDTAQALLRNFMVVPVQKSKILDLTFDYSDPEMVKKILSTLLDLYIPYHIEANAVHGAEIFFSGQGEMYSKKLEEAELELAAFKKKWGISSPEKQKGELIGSIKQIEDLLIEANSNLSQYEYMLNSTKKGIVPSGQLAASATRGNENTVINVIATQLIRAEQKRLQSSEVFGENSRDYRAAIDLVADLSSKLQNAIQNEIDVIKTKKISLEQSLTDKKNELQILEEKSEEAKTLQLRALIAKERYLQYVSKEEEARLENLKVGNRLVNVNIVARPFVPTSPIFPQIGLFTLAAFLISIPLGIGIILMINMFDHTFNHPRDIEQHTGYKVLATVNLLKKGSYQS